MGLDPWIGGAGYTSLSKELRDVLSSHGFFTLSDCGDIGEVINNCQCWVPMYFLSLRSPLKEEWNHFIYGLNRNGNFLRDEEDILVLLWNVSIGYPTTKLEYDALSISYDLGERE